MNEPEKISRPQVVFAVYTPHPGKEDELEALVRTHASYLAQFGLATDRPPLLVRSETGALIEVFEWRSANAALQAHEHPGVTAIWERMAQLCDFSTLGDLPEAKKSFSYFQTLL